jgi:prepilin peptidase CpaA
MAFSPFASYVVLVVTAGTLFYVALTDLKEFRVANELILVLAGLYLVFAALSGHWRHLHWNLALAALMFAVLLYFYARGMLGGGDVKMLTVSFLWVGQECALVFAIVLAVLAGIHTGAARLGWLETREVGGHKRIPFAPSIAGALIGTFMTGCLQPL